METIGQRSQHVSLCENLSIRDISRQLNAFVRKLMRVIPNQKNTMHLPQLICFLLCVYIYIILVINPINWPSSKWCTYKLWGRVMHSTHEAKTKPTLSLHIQVTYTCFVGVYTSTPGFERPHKAIFRKKKLFRAILICIKPVVQERATILDW